MRAVGYFRESPARPSTIAQQNKAFLEFCAREGHENDGTFADAPGSNGHAPGFRELISYVRRHGKGVVVVVPSVESMGDGPTDAARRCFQLVGLGAQVSPLDGDPDVTEGVVTAWTARDGDRLSDRVRAAMRRKAVKGEVLGRPPYGYKVGGRRRLELVPEEAVVVRYIYRLYLQEGMGIRLIARRLNQEDLKTRRGGNWSMVSIRDILRNRAYLGTYARFGVRVPGNHPPLVTADDFNATQDRLNARRTSYAPRVTSQFLLSGLAYCGHCGNKLIGVSRKQSWKRRSGERVENSYRYYQCESRTNQSVCGYHTRRAEELENEVRGAAADAIAAGVPDSDAESTSRDAERERARLQSRLRSIDRRLERYVDAGAKGRLSREKMQKLSVSAAADRLAVEDDLEALDRRLSGAVASGARAAQLRDAWDALAFGERQALLRDVIARVTATDHEVAVSLRP